QTMNLELVDAARRGEEQYRRMGRSNENLIEEIFVAHRHAGAAAAAAPLRAIGRERHALDIAAMADGHDHILALDQRFDIGLEFELLDLGPPRRRELLFDGAQLLANDIEHARTRAEDFEIALDLRDESVEFLGDLVALERGEPLQPQIEDRL